MTSKREKKFLYKIMNLFYVDSDVLADLKKEANILLNPSLIIEERKNKYSIELIPNEIYSITYPKRKYLTYFQITSIESQTVSAFSEPNFSFKTERLLYKGLTQKYCGYGKAEFYEFYSITSNKIYFLSTKQYNCMAKNRFKKVS